MKFLLQSITSTNIVLSLLNYILNQQSNILQTILGYLTFAYNIFKYIIKTFYQTRLVVFYKCICCIFGINTNQVKRKMRK